MFLTAPKVFFDLFSVQNMDIALLRSSLLQLDRCLVQLSSYSIHVKKATLLFYNFLWG